jgi:hypothetical protein
VKSLLGLLIAGVLYAQSPFFPLREVKPGLRGIGRTVFSGDRIEEFQVEILGVLENVGPKQSIVLARLSGGPLEKTGVLQGMSGSPVYIDGRLLGAVAMGFAFSEEPIAGIRPIEEMVRPLPARPKATTRARVWLQDRQLTRVFPKREEYLTGETRLVDIATPVSFSGFTRHTLEQFAPQLRELGLEPRQGISGGAVPGEKYGDPSAIRPGSMISVQLLAGDMSVGAEGTVTYVDGKNIYAFGHRFLSVGQTELPFARAEVLTLLPNLSTSFKISAAREWMGAITLDHSTAVAGQLGRRAALVPVSITVADRAGSSRRSTYHLGMVNDSFLSPILLQTAVYSAIDATERQFGSSSFAIRGQIEFQDGTTPIKLDDMYTGEANVPLQVSLATAVPLAYVMQSGFDALKLKNVSLSIESFDEKRQLQIDQVWPSRQSVRPGEPLDVNISLVGDNGAEHTRKVTYRVPVGAPTGPLNITVADGATTNFTEYQQLIGTPLRSASQVVSFLNSLRSNTRAYVRLWRPTGGFQVQGKDLPGPPASVSLILGRAQAAVGGASLSQASKVAEFQINAGETVISGSKTIQVEVKE